ncbi:MAG: hypothetical protein Fur0035_02640 [Anaerolineales bacterium]
MDIGALLLLLAVILGVAFFVARPFLENSRISVASPAEHELSSLLAERDRLITALQELDFDYTLGKVPADDYPATRADLLQRAADALRRLDSFQASASATGAESRVEAAVAARRADAAIRKLPAAPVAALSEDDALEDILAARRAARADKSAGFCAKCGKPISRADKFCPHCGKSLK